MKYNSVPERITMATKHDESEKTPLTAAEDTSSSTGQPLTIGDAIERIGCGFGSILYVLGPYGVLIMGGAEICVMTIISLIVRCPWNLSTVYVSALQITGPAFFAIFSVFLSNLGDKYGRKPVLLLNTFGTIVFGILCGFCNDFWQLLVCRAIFGAFMGVGLGPASSYSTEIPTIKFRAFGMASNGLGFGIGTAVSSGLAYLTIGPLGWQGYVMVTALICLPFFFVLLLIRESPRHDVQVGKVHEAQKTVKILSKLNCTSDQLDNYEIAEVPNFTIEQEGNTFFQGYQVLKRAGYAFDFWNLACVCSTAQFGHISILYVGPRLMNAGYCSSSVFVKNQSCSFDKSVLFDLGVIGLTDPIGIILGLLVVNQIGRIKLIRVAIIIPMLSLALLYVCAGSKYLLTVLSVTRGSLAILSWSVFVVAGETFPTSVRSFVSSIIFACTSIAGLTSSFVMQYAFELNPLCAIIIIQAALFISGVFSCFIKRETAGTQLDQRRLSSASQIKE
jgi:MFS family permease